MTTETTVPTLQNFVGGTYVDTRDGETIDVTNPATGELIARVPRSRAADVDAAVHAAHQAFPAWRATPATERAACVLALADAIVARKDELARIDVSDNGSPLRDLQLDVDKAAAVMRYFAGLALQLRGETIPGAHGRLNYTLREPFGVVARLIPFNHPVMFATMKIAAPLVAGNTVIVKPSESTPLSALALGDDFARIFPPGVINVVTGYGGEAGDALVAHPLVRRLGFIGSADTGRAIQRRAAEIAVKTVTLELGGKNPLVVFADADLDAAIDAAVTGMNFSFQGQSCGSTSRLLVQSGVHDELVERLTERFGALRVGDPLDESTEVGAIVNERQLDKVLGYVELGAKEGARLRTGGSRITDGELARGLFLEPALFDGVGAHTRLAQEEIFGPVLSVLSFDGYDDAVRIANGTRFGLTAGVFTRDLGTAHTFARDVDAGFVWVNDSSKHFLGVPFGGWKDSGVGSEEGLDELHSYTQLKNVNVAFE